MLCSKNNVWKMYSCNKKTKTEESRRLRKKLEMPHAACQAAT